MFFTEKINHSYPHCWRCKNPIIFRATEQWFLSIDHNNLRANLRKAIEQEVQWVPAAGRERILGMVNTRPDWCLSRQRAWGVPIPAVTCAGCKGEQKLFVEIIEHVAELVKTHGTDIWFEKDIKDLIPAGFKCPTCKGDDFSKAPDILDVWFDSGVSHQAVFHSMIHKPLPADLYLEGSDQHRGWFQSSLIPSVAMDGRAPYRQVLTHGFVVDGQGRKMSKSLGNVVKPQEMIDQNGAEIIRLWVTASSYNDDVRISKEIVDRLVDAYRKIRNTVRYLLGNLHGFNPDTDCLAYDKLQELDRWALHQLALTLEVVDKAYQEYDFVLVYKTLYAFCNETLSSIYLDILKDRLYTFAASSTERLSAQTVLFYIVDSLTKVISPIMAFTSEEIFAVSPKTAKDKQIASVHLANWPDVPSQWKNPALEDHFKELLIVRDEVLKALDEKRKTGIIGSALEAKVAINTSDLRFDYLKKFEPQLPGVFIVSQVSLLKSSKASIDVEKADGVKCGRCWKYTTDVGSQTNHPTLCGFCAQTVSTLTVS